MPTEKYLVVKVVLSDEWAVSPTEAFNGMIEDHKMEWPDTEVGEWSVEGEYDSLAEIGESLFDIDAPPTA